MEKKTGWIGLLLQVVNRPYLLIGLPALLGGMWLILHPQIITENLDKPYALLTGPVAVFSIIAGFVIFKCFKTLEDWWKQGYKAFCEARKEDSIGLFFWSTIVVFLIVSVLSSGQFFDEIIHTVVPGLGYLTALVIDLIAVNALRARLEAVRMREQRGAWLYLSGVALCAGLSAFANLHTGLSGFHHQATGSLPDWMNAAAPWLAMAFPLLILLMSVIADYTVDRTNTRLDAKKYREQEQKRIDVLAVRVEMQQKMLDMEQQLAHVHRDHLMVTTKKDREFFLKQWLLPEKRSVREKNALVEEVTRHLTSTSVPPMQALQRQIQELRRVQENVLSAQQEWKADREAGSCENLSTHTSVIEHGVESVPEVRTFGDTERVIKSVPEQNTQDVNRVTESVADQETAKETDEHTPSERLANRTSSLRSPQNPRGEETEKDTQTLASVPSEAQEEHTSNVTLLHTPDHTKHYTKGRTKKRRETAADRAVRVIKKTPDVTALELAKRAKISATYARKMLAQCSTQTSA